MDRLQLKLEKIGRDPKITANAVGLRYAINTSTGYFSEKKTTLSFFVITAKKLFATNKFFKELAN